MIISMTGYGEASRKLENKVFRIDIRSLNGKTSDIRLRTNIALRDKELELRKLIMAEGKRGKFDVSLQVEITGEVEDDVLNLPMMESYIKKLRSFADEHNIKEGDLIQSIIRLPNIVQATDETLADQEWIIIEEMVREALDKLKAFRKQEGDSLQKDLLERVSNIRALLSSVSQHEDARIKTIRDRMLKNLELYSNKDSIDENRYEQEVIYYLEKLDINEEKVRLDQHCQYFHDVATNDQYEKGKKMAFISQEIGREINTLGAKAQHSDIQQIVVQMKDELEKIKEQTLNTL